MNRIPLMYLILLMPLVAADAAIETDEADETDERVQRLAILDVETSQHRFLAPELKLNHQGSPCFLQIISR